MNFLFLTSLVLIKLPSIIIPFIGTTHTVFRIINVILLLILLFKNRLISVFSNHKTFLLLFLLFFISQGLSIINAINTPVFLNQFEKITQAFIFGLVSLYFFTCKNGIIKKVFLVFLITTLINVILEFFIFFSPDKAIFLFQNFVHSGISDIIEYNLGRNRIYFEFYDELIIPFLLFFLISWKQKIKPEYKVIALLLLMSTILISFWSNFRVRVLMVVFSIVTYMISFFQQSVAENIKKNLSVVAILLITLFFGLNYIVKTNGFSVIDRLAPQDKENEVTIDFRKNMINYSYDIGSKNPIFGVGLGNFYEYLPGKIKPVFTTFRNLVKTHQSTLQYPHNLFAQIFAETGLTGLVSFILLCMYFIKKDWNYIRKNITVNKLFIISFWTLFVYSLFNPPSPLPFWSLFFMLRSLIEVEHKKIYV